MGNRREATDQELAQNLILLSIFVHQLKQLPAHRYRVYLTVCVYIAVHTATNVVRN